MSSFELSDEEQDLLGQVLRHALATLQIEIHRTDHFDYREQLKHRIEVLQRILAKAEEPIAVAA
jgi:hypothetical protein